MTCTKCKEPIAPGISYHRTQRGAHHAVCPPKPTEAQLQQAITEMLTLDGWRPLRTDPCSDRGRGKGFGEPGMADHLYVRYLDKSVVQYPGGYMVLKRPTAEILWIEHKRRGGGLAKHQKTWHQAERARGALTLIAGEDFEASLAGFWTWYAASGLKRKDIRL